MNETCSICGCELHRSGRYATPDIEGRSHATEHHFVAERFFGRSKNRSGDSRQPIFQESPWPVEGRKAVFCYDCHEELIHNPVYLPEDITNFAILVKRLQLNEEVKEASKDKLARRIELLHEVIKRGIRSLLDVPR